MVQDQGLKGALSQLAQGPQRRAQTRAGFEAPRPSPSLLQKLQHPHTGTGPAAPTLPWWVLAGGAQIGS